MMVQTINCGVGKGGVMFEHVGLAVAPALRTILVCFNGHLNTDEITLRIQYNITMNR